MEELTRQIAGLLDEAQLRGMPLPYLFVAAGINGSVMAARYTEAEIGLDAEILAEHIAGDGMMKLPINIMLIDATGEAARILISKEGVTFH